MRLTIHQEDLTENGSLNDFINVVNGRNVICDGVRVHIIDGKDHHAMLGELRTDYAPRFEWRRENIEVYVTM